MLKREATICFIAYSHTTTNIFYENIYKIHGEPQMQDGCERRT